MSKQDDEGLPIGDASHILDDAPAPAVERSTMPVPVTSRTVTPDGEVLREPQPTDQPLAIMPGEVNRLLSSKDRQDDAKRIMEPCPNCQFFSFLVPGSEDYLQARAMLSSFVSNLPTWMRDSVPGRNVEEWGTCQGAPHGRRILVHLVNSCMFFRSKVN